MWIKLNNCNLHQYEDNKENNFKLHIYIYIHINIYIYIYIYTYYIYIYIYRLIRWKKIKLTNVVFLKYFLPYRILLKIFLQIICTINMGIEEIIIDLIIYVHFVNLVQLTVQSQHNIVIAMLNRALLWSYCVKPEQANTKWKTAIRTME